jgi:hypothetical protein
MHEFGLEESGKGFLTRRSDFGHEYEFSDGVEGKETN